MNLIFFFNIIRNQPFGGHLLSNQVSGCSDIINEWASRNSDIAPQWLAYALATAYHETAATMQPIAERGAVSYFPDTMVAPILATFNRGTDIGIEDVAMCK